MDTLNRKYKGHTYTNCFVGKAAVSALVAHNLCLHRKHGVALCQQMEAGRIIHHVLYEKGAPFADNGKDALFQFAIDDEGLDHKQYTDLDVAFGVVRAVETKVLLRSSNADALKFVRLNSKGSMPLYTKLPSTLLQTLNLDDLEAARIRHKSTISQFKAEQDRYVDLPELSGWMEKKSASMMKTWQKRWVIVRRTHMLWSKKRQDTQNPLDPKERHKFNNSMTLLTIKAVRPVSSRRKRKFDVITPSKTYHFKCSTAKQRELWLHGLQLHLRLLAESMKFLRQSFLFKQ